MAPSQITKNLKSSSNASTNGGNRPGDGKYATNDAGSSSSISSNTSSLASLKNSELKVNGYPQNWPATPMTMSESSPPKIGSPRASMQIHFKTAVTEHKTESQPELPSVFDEDAAITPPPSINFDRISIFPPAGESRGYRTVWDPELDSKLGKEEKRKAKPKIKHFGHQVCGISCILYPSLLYHSDKIS